MSFAISGIGAFIDGLVLLFFYYRIRKNNIKDNKFFYFFDRFTLFFGLFYLFFSLPILLVPENSLAIGIGYIIGHAFAYIGFGYLARISWLIAKPAFDSTNILRLYLLLGAALTVLNICFFNYPSVLSNGITEWNQNELVGVLIILFSMTAFLPAAVLFIKQSIQLPQQRKRFALIGASFLLIIIGGPLHDIASQPWLSLVADAVTTSGFVLMFFGVISGTKSVLTNKK